MIHGGETPTRSLCGRCGGVPVPWVARGGGVGPNPFLSLSSSRQVSRQYRGS